MITFQVAKVALAKDALETIEHSKHVTALLQGNAEAHSHRGVNVVTGYRDNWNKPEAGTTYHNFIMAAHLAFNDHRPLIISPDHIWLMIAQGLAIHINKNAEELRHHFVNFKDKKYIEIQRDYFVKGSPDNDWQGCFPEFSDKLAEFIGKKRDLIVANFSTTGLIEKAVSEITLMDAMQSYFDFGCKTACGIPEITLEGTVEDYKNIKQRVRTIGEFGLSWWTEHLLPTIDQFIAALKGQVDVEFWKSFYHEGGASGGPYINGWVNNFLPYIKVYSGFQQNESIGSNDNKYGFGGITHDLLPSGMSKVPFKWHYYDQVFDMQFIGGFMGVTQSEGLALRPQIGWAVKEASETKSAPVEN